MNQIVLLETQIELCFPQSNSLCKKKTLQPNVFSKPRIYVFDPSRVWGLNFELVVELNFCCSADRSFIFFPKSNELQNPVHPIWYSQNLIIRFW